MIRVSKSSSKMQDETLSECSSSNEIIIAIVKNVLLLRCALTNLQTGSTQTQTRQGRPAMLPGAGVERERERERERAEEEEEEVTTRGTTSEMNQIFFQDRLILVITHEEAQVRLNS